MLEIITKLPSKAYAPELYALRDFLSATDFARLTLADQDVSDSEISKFDLEYRMMGTAPKWRRSILPEIHDYASLSTGRNARAKDLIKTVTTRKPFARSYLNQYVRDALGHNDEVPSILRDMGVPSNFYIDDDAHVVPSYDFVYIGSITRSRGVDRLADWAVTQGVSLLLIGSPEPEISNQFKYFNNISFAGVLSRNDIPSVARTARFAVNYTPAVAPFDRQTSTKILEYLALGLPVVTNDYYWVQKFEISSGARMLSFSTFDSLSMSDIESFKYQIPDMREYQWDEVWKCSGIRDILYSFIKGSN